MDVDAATILDAIRSRRPLVHCLTNAVTIGRVADALAALGALPVMASAREEASDMTAHAQALVLNLGTPSADRFVAAAASGERARELGVPVVLDPVGCGSTQWRTQQMRMITSAIRPGVVRGNAAEIAALADIPSPVALRGVTADRANVSTATVAREGARRLGSVVLLTGAIDVLADGQRMREHQAPAAPVLARVVGAGDVLSALVGACCAVVPDDPFAAAASGLTLFRQAVAHAAAESHQPGSFWLHLIDALAMLEASELPPGATLAEAR